MKGTDRSVVVQDKAGNRTTLTINGDSLRECLENGHSFDDAKEMLLENAFWKAVARGELTGDEAIIIEGEI